MSGRRAGRAPVNPGAGLEDLAARAVGGDRPAIDALVRALQHGIYHLSLKMLGHPQDAEDATQEVLAKVITRLARFRGESSLRTWVFRIAVNHLLTTRKSRAESVGLTFEAFEQMLAAGVAAGLPPPPGPEKALLEEEVKLGCTQSMLSCLDREHRLAFILADIFEVTGEEGAAALDIEPAAFRKRLSRARQKLREFMTTNCGLVSEAAACRCSKQIGPLTHAGMVDPAHLVHAGRPSVSLDDPLLRRQLQAIEEVDRTIAVYREQPRLAAPAALQRRLRRLVERSP
jgi:RNA polymerase sigma factor (sigma-70 family)